MGMKKIRKYPVHRALRMNKFFLKKSIYADFCADSYFDVRAESVSQSVFSVLYLVVFFLGIKVLLVGSAIVRFGVKYANDFVKVIYLFGLFFPFAKLSPFKVCEDITVSFLVVYSIILPNPYLEMSTGNIPLREAFWRLNKMLNLIDKVFQRDYFLNPHHFKSGCSILKQVYEPFLVRIIHYILQLQGLIE